MKQTKWASGPASLVFSVERDGDGWLVCEQDGSGRDIKWGPMPFNSIVPFIDDRKKVIRETIESELERMKHQAAEAALMRDEM